MMGGAGLHEAHGESFMYHPGLQGAHGGLGAGQSALKMGGVWGSGVEDSRFESLPGITSSSPMVCSPPMSPQSVRTCVSPLMSRPIAHHLLPSDRFGLSKESSLKEKSLRDDKVLPFEKSYSEDFGAPASVPTRIAPSAGLGLGLGDDISLSQEKIASRLSIIKTRRGRTSSSRRGLNAASAPAHESAFGLGDTRPDSSLFASNAGDDRADLVTPLCEKPGGGVLRERGQGLGRRPSQSAPTSVAGSNKKQDDFERIQLERERRLAESMEVRSGCAGCVVGCMRMLDRFGGRVSGARPVLWSNKIHTHTRTRARTHRSRERRRERTGA